MRSTQQTLRRAALAVSIVLALCELFTWQPNSPTPWLVGMLLNVGLALTAAVLAAKAAQKFDAGELSRRVWWCIAFLAAADCGVLVTFTAPKIWGNVRGLVGLTLATSLLTTFSRGIALPLALWMMVGVYRRSDLHLKLGGADYAAMAIVAAFGIVALAMVENVARSQLFMDDPVLVRTLRLIGLLLLPAMMVTSVFGVMIWRYAKQMGGGLVARAWICILLCTVFWLARFAMLGALNKFFGMQANQRPTSVEMLSFWMVAASEFLLFAGASFQYQACTELPSVDESELSLLAAQFDNQQRAS